MRVSWTTRRSHQSVLKEINPEYSSEGLLLNPKLQYFGHMVGKANSLEKTLMLGKTEGKRRGAAENVMVGSITNLMDRNLSKLWDTVKDREDWHAAVHGLEELGMT